MAESTYSMEDARPVFYIGEHETKRPLPVTTELVQHAHDLGVSPAFFFSSINSRPQHRLDPEQINVPLRQF